MIIPPETATVAMVGRSGMKWGPRAAQAAAGALFRPATPFSAIQRAGEALVARPARSRKGGSSRRLPREARRYENERPEKHPRLQKYWKAAGPVARQRKRLSKKAISDIVRRCKDEPPGQ